MSLPFFFLKKNGGYSFIFIKLLFNLNEKICHILYVKIQIKKMKKTKFNINFFTMN